MVQPERTTLPVQSFRLGRSTLVALALAVAGACGADGGGADDRRPNVVLLVVDTLRGDMVLGKDHAVETPGFDLLAEEGVVFEHAFAHAPMTLPSHAALFSSRAPFETGVLNNWQNVREDLPLFAEHVRDHGYATHAVISLGTLDPRKRDALNRGFDTYDVDYWHMDPAPAVMSRIEKTLDTIDASAPFFLFAHFSDPHSPYNAHGTGSATAEILLDGESMRVVPTSDMTQVDDELELTPGKHTLELRSDTAFRLNTFEWTHEGRYLTPTWEVAKTGETAKLFRTTVEVSETVTTRLRYWVSESIERQTIAERYVLEVKYIDDYVRQFVEQLKARGLWDNTIVVFTSDHGEALGEKGVIGHVQNLHDEMLHVPLSIKLPKGLRVDAIDAARDELVPHMDIVPTLLELMALPPLPGQRGRSLLHEREPILIAQTHEPEAREDSLCVRDDEFKLILRPADGSFRLFDLKADPGEATDVFEARHAERSQWVDLLETIATLVAEGPGPLDDVDDETRALLDALGY